MFSITRLVCALTSPGTISPSLSIQRDFAGTKDEIANTNGLRVRPDCRGGLRGGDDFLHGAMSAGLLRRSQNALRQGSHFSRK